MTHRGVEIVLGRLATDRALRERFRVSPETTLRELVASGVELSGVERAALGSLDPGAVGRFALALDPRIQRAVLVGGDGDEPGRGPGGAL
jgi:hypothetical protein